MKTRQNIQSMYQKSVKKQTNKQKKHVVLLLMGEEGKKHYVLIKDFNAYMCDHTLQHGRKILPLLLTSLQYRRNIKISN